MAKRRKSSKGPDPINAFLDIAGAATMGLYVKNKVKKTLKMAAARSLQRLLLWYLVWDQCAAEVRELSIWAA